MIKGDLKNKIILSYSVEEIKSINEAGRDLLPLAKSFSRNICHLDPATAEDLMQEAVEKTLRYKAGKLDEIENLPAYLFKVYRHTLLAWVKQKQREVSFSEPQLEITTTSYQEIEKKILVSEIVSLMSVEEKFIYKNLTFGCSYDEISKEYNEKFKKNFLPNVLRSKFSKAVKRISRKLLNE